MEKKINRDVIRTGETDIKVHLIDSFPNHPYHVFDDEDMTELAASIEANGLLNPIIVRSKADGRYELISGHRRKRAYEILKINKIRAIIVDVTDDEAIIMMVDSNCQRSKILPSEKAFSYKMKLDAIKRQGKRNDLTSTQVVSKLGSSLIYSASSERKADDLFFVDKAIRDEEARIIEYGKLAVSSDHKEEDYKLAIKDSSGRIESLKIQREQIVRQLSCNDAAKKEMERIDKYLLENRAVVDTYNDSTVRRLISSIEVTPELDLKIYIKGGYEITEKYTPLKNVS